MGGAGYDDRVTDIYHMQVGVHVRMLSIQSVFQLHNEVALHTYNSNSLLSTVRVACLV